MNKNLNTNNTNKKQNIETKDYYIEMPYWLNPHILEENNIYCTQQDNNLYEFDSYDNDFILLDSIKQEIKVNTNDSNNKNSESKIEDIHFFNLKDEILKKYNIRSINFKKVNYWYLLLPICFIPTVNVVNTYWQQASDVIAKVDILNNKVYTFNNVPTEIFNLSQVASNTNDLVFDNFIYKQEIGVNNLICIGYGYGDTDTDLYLTKLNSENNTMNSFKINTDGANSVSINNVIELPNRDFVINATLNKGEYYNNVVLHYSKNGNLKTQKVFNEEIIISDLCNQPDSENYFIVLKDSQNSKIQKLTGNGNMVFEYNINKTSIEGINIFPIKRDIQVFVSYYNEENDLIADMITLNALGKEVDKKEIIGTNIGLSNGFITSTNTFLFEESKLNIPNIKENNLTKIDKDGIVKVVTEEKFDFFSNKIFELDNGFISVRETIFTPNEDEYTSFTILTFVKFDKHGKEEWRKYVNYYNENENPITNNTFTLKHLYLQNNKIIVEGLAEDKSDNYKDIYFSIDSDGSISKIDK